MSTAFNINPTASARIITPGSGGGTPSGPQPPTGVFCLPQGGNINSLIFTPPISNWVDGFVIGGSWYDFEPQPGVYNFTQAVTGNPLSDWIAAIEAVGKPARLTIATAGDGIENGGHKPNWLTNRELGLIANDGYEGGKFFTWSTDGGMTSTTIPVFWEPTLLQRLALLYQAVAEYIRPHPLVKVVHIQYANAAHDDWNLGSIDSNPDGLPDGLSPLQRWVNALVGSGFDTFADAVTFAGNTCFTNAIRAFNGLYLMNSIGRIEGPLPSRQILNPGDTEGLGRNVSNAVVNNAIAAYPTKIIPVKENLDGGWNVNGNTGGVQPAPGGITPWNDLYNFQHCFKAGQMVWQAYGDFASCPTNPNVPYEGRQMNWAQGGCLGSTRLLKSAIDQGLTYGLAWQEIYTPDLINLSLPNNDPDPGTFTLGPNVIAYGHSLLKRILPPLH